MAGEPWEEEGDEEGGGPDAWEAASVILTDEKFLAAAKGIVTETTDKLTSTYREVQEARTALSRDGIVSGRQWQWQRLALGFGLIVSLTFLAYTGGIPKDAIAPLFAAVASVLLTGRARNNNA